MSLPQWAWATGALAGGALVLLSALWGEAEPVGVGSPVAAMVNGEPIPVADVEIALEAMARDSRNPLPDDAAERALNRLIDEELLFQRALELELPRTAPTVRRTIVMTMIDLAQSSADQSASEAGLRALFDNNRGYFAAQNRYRVRWQSAPSADGRRVRPAAHPPDRLLSASDLRRYLGDTLSSALLPLRAGENVGPVSSGNRYHWLQVLEFAEATPQTFEENRERVEALWQERAGEAALERYIADLRRDAEIRLQPMAPP